MASLAALQVVPVDADGSRRREALEHAGNRPRRPLRRCRIAGRRRRIRRAFRRSSEQVGGPVIGSAGGENRARIRLPSCRSFGSERTVCRPESRRFGRPDSGPSDDVASLVFRLHRFFRLRRRTRRKREIESTSKKAGRSISWTESGVGLAEMKSGISTSVSQSGLHRPGSVVPSRCPVRSSNSPPGAMPSTVPCRGPLAVVRETRLPVSTQRWRNGGEQRHRNLCRSAGAAWRNCG